jgi:hypothetical protein
MREVLHLVLCLESWSAKCEPRKLPLPRPQKMFYNSKDDSCIYGQSLPT